MKVDTPLRDGMWSELIDRDLNLLIEGKPPFNEDLAPLESFVVSLCEFADVPVSPEFVRDHAAKAAANMQLVKSANANSRLTGSRRLAFALRRRVGAAATSLMMIVGMTGVAWAADSAVPGDWNYGIDRALEAIGIGAGGAEERLTELTLLSGEKNSGRSESAPGPASANSQDQPAGSAGAAGPTNAAATVAEITAGSEQANETRAAVSTLLDHLAGGIDGQMGADYAKQFRPENVIPGSQRPEDASGAQNRPENAAKPAETGKPGS